MTPEKRQALRDTRGVIFDIDETATHDGPGLRMAVYLKGCPLRCVWCHSPESMFAAPQIVRYEGTCTECGACVGACPQGLRSLSADAEPDPSRCLRCEACLRVCPSGALDLKGEEVSAGQIVDRALRQRAFHEASGGGVTLTGGEPTMQPVFTAALLGLLREHGVHTALETTGLAPWPALEELAPMTSLFLYDLKHADDGLHRRDTGVSNTAILQNLARLAAIGADIVVRVPCIPGLNASPESIRSIARVAKAAGCDRISLLPYNPATPGKYSWLQKPYPLADLKAQSPTEMAALEDVARGEGLAVVPP